MGFTKLFRIEFEEKRIYGLDIIRAFAILTVVYSHGIAFLIPLIPSYYLNLINIEGVSVFFVLSGFLIGGILVKTIEKEGFNRKALFNFWIRRWFRTLPNYYLIFFLISSIYYFYYKYDPPDQKYYLVFMQNFAWRNPDFFPEAWSLSVEEWFYLLIPLLLFVLIALFRLKNKDALIFTVFFVIISLTLFKYYKYIAHIPENISAWDFVFRKEVITRLDSIMYGVAGACLANYKPVLWNRYRYISLNAGIILFTLYQANIYSLIIRIEETNYPVQSLYTSVFLYPQAALAVLLTLPFFSSIKSGKYRVVLYISTISYSMYLTHLSLVRSFMVPELMKHINTGLVSQALISYALYLFLTFTCSILLYKYFEKPVMDLRDKLPSFKSKPGPYYPSITK
jgi:peptidoglycan/LPS O-acetylase OafA/YrhL